MKLYRHLAWDGIRKNSRLYVPYLLTGVGAVSFFYILVALSRLPGGTLPGSGSVQVILNLGSFVLWVFSLLLLFYTHSFLIRRRNREFALYNVLASGTSPGSSAGRPCSPAACPWPGAWPWASCWASWRSWACCGWWARQRTWCTGCPPGACS